MNYSLNSLNKEGTLLLPHHSYYSDEYAQSHCDLYLSDEFEGNAYHNNIKQLYRLMQKSLTTLRWRLPTTSSAHIAAAGSSR